MKKIKAWAVISCETSNPINILFQIEETDERTLAEHGLCPMDDIVPVTISFPAKKEPLTPNKMNKCICGHDKEKHKKSTVTGSFYCLECPCYMFAPKPEDRPDDQRDKKNVPDKDLINQQDRPAPSHNHCWREDGTCYGAYGDGENGKCSLIHEGIKKLGSKKYYETTAAEKEKLGLCKKCGRTSEVVNLSEACPFCAPEKENKKDWEEELDEFWRKNGPNGWETKNLKAFISQKKSEWESSAEERGRADAILGKAHIEEWKQRIRAALLKEIEEKIQKEVDEKEGSKDDFSRAHRHGLQRALYLLKEKTPEKEK